MTIRWGFLGAGYVASRAMAPAVHTARGAVLQSVASRNMGRSATLEPLTVATSYQQLLEDPLVDAVYVSLTNVQHREWVIAALQSGKHVLCEKPLGLNADEVLAMRKEAEFHQRLLVEATWIRWHPRFKRLVEIATSEAFGEILTIDSSFTFENAESDNYRWQPAWGGGALLDVGCYQAHVWMAITGCNADVVVTDVERHMSTSGVDATTTATVKIDRTKTATMQCSFILPAEQRLVISSKDHQLTMATSEAFTSWREPSSLQIDDVTETFPAVDAFVVMVEEMSAHLDGADGWVVPLEETMKVARVLDEIAATPTR